MRREPNITRMGYARNHGWWVRFYRGRAGEQRCISKSFSDAAHGGKRKALQEARRWRDQMAPKVPGKPRRQNAPPGYGYVRRAETMQRADRWPRFVAWIRLDRGRCASTSYSVTRWGELGAKQKCEAWLDRKRRELRNRQPRER